MGCSSVATTHVVCSSSAIARGALLDRDGIPLATSERTTGAYMRNYSDLADTSILGEVETGVGISGPEAAFDALLRGEPVDPLQEAVRSLLHESRPGADVRLTLSADVQAALHDAMGDAAGAAVVISLPSGEILGMISQPPTPPADATPEPNASPPANLALTGAYEVDAALLPGALSAVMLQGVDIARTEFRAGTCAVRLPPDQVVTLQEAFLFACPEPFAAATANIAPEAMNSTLSSFLVQPADGALNGLLPAPATASAGTSERTASPLSIALMAAAIAEDGAAPAPQLGLSSQAPGSDEWTPLTSPSPQQPVTTATTARRLQDLMRQAVAEGAAQNAGRPRLDIGGIVALAGSEDAPVAWFTGFTSLPGHEGAAVAVVLDGTRDTGLAADIGGAALEAAAAVLQREG